MRDTKFNLIYCLIVLICVLFILFFWLKLIDLSYSDENDKIILVAAIGLIGAIIGGAISGLLTFMGVRYTIIRDERKDIIKEYPKKRRLGDELSGIVIETWRSANRCINGYRDISYLLGYLENVFQKRDSLLIKASMISDEAYEEIRSRFLVNIKEFITLLNSAKIIGGDFNKRLNYYLLELDKSSKAIIDINQKLTDEYKNVKDGL